MPPFIDMKIPVYSKQFEEAWLVEEDLQRRKANKVIVIGACMLGPMYAFVEYFSNKANVWPFLGLISLFCAFMLFTVFVLQEKRVMPSNLVSHFTGFTAAAGFMLLICLTDEQNVSYYVLSISTVIMAAGVMYFGKGYNIVILSIIIFAATTIAIRIFRPEDPMVIPYLTQVYFVSIFVVAFSAMGIQFRYKITKENFMNELKLKETHQLLEERNKEVTESITYAKNIQLTILPDKTEIDRDLKEYFIFYQPKDIVSGDFYWHTKIGNRIFLAAVDCTGHGVPGAFMSVLGYNTLNHVVSENATSEPSVILHKLDEGIRRNLKQDDGLHNSSDGMDIALCIIEPSNNIIHFSSANRALMKIKDGVVEEIKGDKFPIGGKHSGDKKFNSHTIVCDPDALYYMFTDGVMDQFGGNDGKKFTKKRLLELLTKNASLPMVEQHKIISDTFNKWKGGLEQTDDVTLIGFKAKF